MMPIRPICDAIGASIEWDAANDIAKIYKGQNKISIPIGESYAYKNGQKIYLGVRSRIINGYTMIPVRFVSESFGSIVEWDSNVREVKIYY